MMMVVAIPKRGGKKGHTHEAEQTLHDTDYEQQQRSLNLSLLDKCKTKMTASRLGQKQKITRG